MPVSRQLSQCLAESSRCYKQFSGKLVTRK